MSGGSHLAKISIGAPYFAALPSETDDDLVLVADAYDVWLQLPPQILVQRWRDVTNAADIRTSKSLEGQTSRHSFQHSIVFGAGKRCTPNLRHTVACYAVPESPLPRDLYGSNTDTIVGKNRWSSLRQRYLNAGIAIGTVADMRRVFRRAKDKLAQVKPHEDFDNGSHESDFVYHGSDQSVWNTIFGEQEFQRETMRRDEKPRGAVAPSWMEGTKIDDPINPSFTHQTMERAAPGQYEFGIALDYCSGITQQTINSEQDARILHYSKRLEEQMSPTSLFDCKPRSSELPTELQRASSPFNLLKDSNTTWSDVPLYTNICLDSIPVIVHHNGIKTARESMWNEFWVSGLLKMLHQKGFFSHRTLAVADQKELLMRDVCPASAIEKILGKA
ncbi:hypothetical protein Slin15195_G013250 [Septoria linicola]|uniref:Uncharacterized protein n=1 Tax=Septoria linicola TaxID=215465 RepID=A0A9Q9AL81_9PEZI|nr:hypothetical protein Slin15195_G013250 [Septoria linicola]